MVITKFLCIIKINSFFAVKERLPLPFVYNSWLQETITNNKDIVENINQLFSYFTNNDIHPTRDVTDNLLTVLKPLSYIGSYTSMSNK